MKQSRHVSNYFVKKHSNGMFSLTFNTHERWVHCFRRTYTEFEFDNAHIHDDNDEHTIDHQEIEGIPEGSYLISMQQDKNQITFYYMPFEMLRYGEVIKTHENK